MKWFAPTRAISRFVLGALVGAPLSVGACSGGSDGNSGGSCSHGNDCPTWDCTCNSGSTVGLSECINGVCGDQSICDSACKNNGGVKSVTEAPSVKGTPECTAFCQKIASLGCGSCDQSFWCTVGPHECPDAKRAQLQCKVDTGTWKCAGQGGWTESDSCSTAECGPDGGTDAKAD
jgi:hypothetical protein